MPLKISLKPGERLVVGGGVIRADGAPARIIIENKVPVLREKEILSAEAAVTPAKRLYFLIQLMYFDEDNLASHYSGYWPLAYEVSQSLEGAEEILGQVNAYLFDREYYKALKCVARLIGLEK